MSELKIMFFGTLFLIFQFCVSFTDWELYPFNPYRMFAKNWKENQMMLEVQAINSGGEVRFVSDQLGIPFFQANRLLGGIFYFKKNKKDQEAMCLTAKKWVSFPVNGFQTLGVLYRRADNGAMIRQIAISDPIIYCGVDK